MKNAKQMLMIFLLISVSASAALYEGFEDTVGLSVSADYDVDAVVTVDTSDKVDGLASLKLAFTVPPEQNAYRNAYIIKSLVGLTDMTNLNISFSVCPVNLTYINSVYLYLYDTSGKKAYWRWWSGMSSGVWTKFEVVQGQQSGANNYIVDIGFDPRSIKSVLFRLRSMDYVGGQEVSLKWDDFQANDSEMTPVHVFVDDTLGGITDTAEQIGKTYKLDDFTKMHTTFEADSAGSGTWDSSPDWGWGDGDDPDITSGVQWLQGGGDSQVYISSAAYVGSQCGSVTGGKYAKLDFGSSENTGIYRMTWYQKYKDNSSTSAVYSGLIICNDASLGGWGNKSFALLMLGESGDTTTIKAYGATSNGTEEIVTLLSSYLDDTWYKFELILDYTNKTYAIKVKQAGAANWEATASSYLQNPTTYSDSFDQMWCKGSASTVYAYFDNIKVEELQGTNQITIYAGVHDDPYIAPLVTAANLSFDTSWVGNQGFYIKSFDADKMLVTANTSVGIMYGLMELLDCICQDGFGVLEQTLNIADRPKFSVRQGISSKRANFVNSWCVDRASPVFRYDDNPEVFNDVNETFKQDYLQTVEDNRDNLRSGIASAADYGAKLYMATYQPSLPLWAVDAFIAAHSECEPARQTEFWHPSICPSQQASKDLLYNKIKNLFADVDDISGILLNIGECDQSIYSCGCSTCNAQSYKDRLIEYVLLIREAMLEAVGLDPNYSYPNNPDVPKVYLRPWAIINHGLGSEEEFESLAGLLPEDVRFWTKVTVPPGGDYLWNDHFTSLIDMPRMETFGWHLYHPNLNQPCIAQLCYTAPKLKARAVALAALGVNGQGSCDSIDTTEPLYEPSRLASSKIAWDPCSFDSNDFLIKWATKKFGEDVNSYVADAMKDTYKITDAFTTIDSLHTGWYQMMGFVKDKSLNFYNSGCALSQPDNVKNVSVGTLSTVLSQFDISEEINIATDANQNLAQAVALEPNDSDLNRFWTMSKATVALTKFYKNYHYAVIYNNLYQNTGNSTYRDTAVSYINLAKPDAENYVYLMNQLYPKFDNYFREFDTEWNMGYEVVPGSYYHFGQMAGIDQQCKTGHSRLVMEPYQIQNYPYLEWEVENPDTKIGYDRYSPYTDEQLWPYIYETLLAKWQADEYVLDLDASGPNLPAIISPWILPTLRVKFTSDLSHGGMLVIKFVPLGPPARYSLIIRKSIQNIVLDGNDVTTLVDIATDDTLIDNEFVRYVELPPTGTGIQQHELMILSQPGVQPECIGTEFYNMKLHTPILIEQEEIVNTTFEKDSAGAGTWDTAVSVLWDEPDIASGVPWVAGGSTWSSGFGYGGEAYEGMQCGMTTGNKFAYLDFASGENTGTYTITWYQKYEDQGAAIKTVYGVMSISDDDDTSWAGKSFALLMLGGTTGPTIIEAHGADALGNEQKITLLSSYLDDTWYKFEMALNYTDKTYAIKVKQAGAANWEATANSYLQNPGTATSFDQIWCKGSDGQVYAYWDDIKVVPVCGGLGYSVGDLNEDCSVNMTDLVVFISRWLDIECSSSNLWCDGADIDESVDVDFVDFAILAENWLEDRQN